MIQKYLSGNSYLDIYIFTLLTALSIYNGQTTVFYVIYFFWWNELICLVVDTIFNRFYRKEKSNGVDTYGSFFLMFIYGVFITVFFGFIANWDNQEIIFTNLRVFLFMNWFFNINLAIVLFKRIYANVKYKQEVAAFGAFTNNMIILHISIILGGLLMFFVVKNFPLFFTPDNLLGSVLIITPFLGLKLLFHYLSVEK